jgi:hypothetical protein
MAEHGMPGPQADEELWKRKVRSLDDTLKSLRNADPKSKPGKAKKPELPKQAGRGLFSFRHPKVAPHSIPIEPHPQPE